MLKQDPAREPNLKMPEQPMLPFEQSVPADSNDEPEIEPSEVWEALPRAMKAEGSSRLSAHDAGGDR